MPRRSLRIRVGGLVLAIEADRPTRALDPPASVRENLREREREVAQQESSGEETGKSDKTKKR